MLSRGVTRQWHRYLETLGTAPLRHSIEGQLHHWIHRRASIVGMQRRAAAHNVLRRRWVRPHSPFKFQFGSTPGLEADRGELARKGPLLDDHPGLFVE